MKRKQLFALALVLLVGTLLFVILDKPSAVPAVMVLPPGPLVLKSGRAPDRWIPATWSWLHRACEFVFGAPKQAGFFIQHIVVSGTKASVVAQNSLGPSQAESNGVAVWMLPDGIPDKPKWDASIVCGSSLNTADQMEARVTDGSDATNYTSYCFARLGKEMIDFSIRRIAKSGGRTNLVQAVRAQLPYGQALFVLDVRQPDLATNRMGFVITEVKYAAKGNKVKRNASRK